MRWAWILVAAGLVAVAGPGAGQFAGSAADEPGRILAVGGDVFRIAGTVVHEAEGAGDVFAAGERVRLAAAIAGSAHLVGRRAVVEAPVGSDLYAAGFDVVVGAPVSGSAAVFGYDVAVEAEIGGGLRAAGVTVHVAAPVGGSAVLAGREVTFDAPIAGDVALRADSMGFGAGAAIGGRLVFFGEEAQAARIPARVVPQERIEVRAPIDWEERQAALQGPTLAAAVGAYVFGIAVLALLAFLASVIAPVGVEVLRERTAARPFAVLGLGFVTLSALIGASVVVAMTIVGLVVVPLVVLLALLFGFAGYVVAVYMIGAALWEALRRGEPVSAGEQAAAALMGAVVAALVFLVPIMGWLFMLAAVLIGMGGMAEAWLRRRETGGTR
jgi:hypothetical protein